MVLEKTPESSLDSKEIKPVNIQEVNPEYSLEGLMLKLKLQYFGHLIRTADSLEKSLMLGKIEDRSRRGRQWIRCLDGITDAMDMNLVKLQESVRNSRTGLLLSMGLQTVGHDWATEQQHHYSLILILCYILICLLSFSFIGP